MGRRGPGLVFRETDSRLFTERWVEVIMKASAADLLFCPLCEGPMRQTRKIPPSPPFSKGGVRRKSKSS